MTQKQMKMLEFIKEYWNEHGYCPSYDEIGGAMGIASRSNVHRVIYCLIDRGYLKNMPRRARSLVLVDNPLAKA